VSKPPPVFLDRAEQIRALLDAAGELDNAARRDRRQVLRRPLLATLVFGGLRIGELLDLCWRDVDLSAGRITVRASKTDAGIRQVEMLPVLRYELLELKMAVRHTEPNDLVFGTGEATRQNASNIRNRLLAPAVKRANEHLAAAGEVPLPDGLTPHKLRHSAISLWFAAGHELPRVMKMAGHKHAQVTLGIYAHVMLFDEDAREQLRELVGLSHRAADRAAVAAESVIAISPTH
jgi:integrase